MPEPTPKERSRIIADDAHRIYGQRDERDTEGFDGALAELAEDHINAAVEAAIKKNNYAWEVLVVELQAAEREPYREYIAFLEKACNDSVVFLNVHGMKISDEDFAKGERLRAALAPAEKEKL